MKKYIKSISGKISIPISSWLAYLGFITSIFIPISVLIIQDGIELKIDNLVVINDVLKLNLYLGTIFVILAIIFIKILVKSSWRKLSCLMDVVLIALFVFLTSCLFVIVQNSIEWLSDIPISMASDNSYTSNPNLSKTLDGGQDVIAVRPNKISSYKKQMRLLRINNARSLEEQELLWEVFWNDENTYDYEGKNELWIYMRDYMLFLSNMDEQNKTIAEQGFRNLLSHVEDVGSHVDEYDICSYLPSTMLMLKFEEYAWRSEMWAELVSKYMSTAIVSVNIYDTTRACWLGSLPGYFVDKGLDVGSDKNLEVLALELWDTYNSLAIQEPVPLADLSSIKQSYVKEFYDALGGSTSAEEFYIWFKAWLAAKD